MVSEAVHLRAIIPGIGDELGALMCAFAVCAALYAREKTGKGQRVDTSLMGGLIAMERLVLSARLFGSGVLSVDKV